MPDTVPPDRPESQPTGQSLTSSDREEILGLLLDSLHAEIAEKDQQYIEAMREALAYREMFLWTMDELFTEQAKRIRAEERLKQVMGVKSWHPEETETRESQRHRL